MKQSIKPEDTVNIMYEALLNWLDEEETYKDLTDMIESAEEYIDDFLIKTNHANKLCDKGLISVQLFSSHIFFNEPWDTSSIFYTLVEEVIDVASLKDAKKAVSCLKELLQFQKALKDIEVKIVPKDD
jgi:lysyl-tRNA synthetase class II